MWSLVWVAIVAAPSVSTVTPFRTEVSPRVDPVFGDVTTLRHTVDRFLTLYGEMEQVRSEFATAVHGTLAELVPPPPRVVKGCPGTALAQYARALAAGGRYLHLGRQLETRYRDIRRSDELGDAAGLTPDYRWKVKKARELYLELLRDYREMRVAFYDQLGAELRHAGCRVPGPGAPGLEKPDGDPDAEPPPDPVDPNAWQLEEPAILPDADKELTTRAAKPGTPPPAAAPAIWIEIDNASCAQPSRLSIDGVSVGPVSARKKVSVRTRAGPREICVLPATDKRTCGDAGTVRKVYLYEGWTVIVRCE
jgi:hypothetical protein